MYKGSKDRNRMVEDKWLITINNSKQLTCVQISVSDPEPDPDTGFFFGSGTGFAKSGSRGLKYYRSKMLNQHTKNVTFYNIIIFQLISFDDKMV